MHDPLQTCRGDRGSPSHFRTPPQLFRIRLVVSPSAATENLWENAPIVRKCL